MDKLVDLFFTNPNVSALGAVLIFICLAVVVGGAMSFFALNAHNYNDEKEGEEKQLST